jgi:hypothetical protein
MEAQVDDIHQVRPIESYYFSARIPQFAARMSTLQFPHRPVKPKDGS